MYKFLALSLAFLLSACSGSGGGSGEGTSGVNRRPNTGFRVMHAGIDFPPVDISIAGAEAPLLGSTRFSQSTNYFSQDAATNTINLLRANLPSELVASTQLSLSQGDVRTILLYGDSVVFGKKVAIIEDPDIELSDTESAVRVVHGALAASEIAASANGTLITTDTPYGGASDYLVTPAGDTVLRVRRVADSAIIYEATVTLEAGVSYSLLISGEVDYLTRGELIRF